MGVILWPIVEYWFFFLKLLFTIYYILFFYFPGLDGLPLPTTPSTKKARAGQLNKKDQIAESLKVPVLINAAHLRRGIRGAMRDGPTSMYAHCS